MGAHDILVLGASAGGLAPLQTMMGGLPGDLAASLFVVMHIPASSPSLLPHVLSRAGPLVPTHASDGAVIERGHVYVAPPDHHLIVTPGRMYLRRGARENGSRPAIDPLFRSAAEAFGPRVLGVILSGTRTDGAAGLADVERHGGMSVVQSPDDALYSGMPLAAIELTRPDFVAPADGIAKIVRELVEGGTVVKPPVAEPSAPHAPGDAIDALEVDRETAVGVPSPFSCPDCHGVLWNMPGAPARFRCRTGHDYSGDSLLEEQTSDLESVLWGALRGAQESAALARRLEIGAKARNHQNSARYFAQRYALACETIRKVRAALSHSLAAPAPAGLPEPGTEEA